MEYQQTLLVDGINLTVGLPQLVQSQQTVASPEIQ